jgi:hypothetical protein
VFDLEIFVADEVLLGTIGLEGCDNFLGVLVI